jgi:hypothetical protein
MMLTTHISAFIFLFTLYFVATNDEKNSFKDVLSGHLIHEHLIRHISCKHIRMLLPQAYRRFLCFIRIFFYSL